MTRAGRRRTRRAPRRADERSRRGGGTGAPARAQRREGGRGGGGGRGRIVGVEYMPGAFPPAARGRGDTTGSPSLLPTRQRHTTISAPPIHETFALITRRGAHLSP